MAIFRCEELKADHYSNNDVTTKDSTATGSPQWIPQGFPTFRHLSFEVCVCVCVCCVCVCACVCVCVVCVCVCVCVCVVCVCVV